MHPETSEWEWNNWTSKTVVWKQWTQHWEEKRGEGFFIRVPGDCKNEREIMSLSGEWGRECLEETGSGLETMANVTDVYQRRTDRNGEQLQERAA